MALTAFSLRNPILVTLLGAGLLLLGLVAFARLGRSILPPVALPVVTVTAPYPGAASSEIERLVVEPIEDELDGMPNVERVSATAQNGVAQLVVQFHFGSSEDTDRTYVQQAVDSARPNLPQDIVSPVVSKADPAQAPVLEEAVSSVLLPQSAIAALVTRGIVPALQSAPAIGFVQTAGAAVRQITVEPDAAALSAVNGTPLDVFRAVASSNDLLPGGVLRSASSEAQIGIDAQLQSADRLTQLPVSIPTFGTVRLADVARVRDEYADPSVITRVDGDGAVLLYISRAQSTGALESIAAARAAFARFSQMYPELRFQEVRSDEPATQAAIAGVLQTLGEGVVLTVLVMLLFLHAWRNAVIAAIAIPASLCAAFVAMWAFGFTLNVLSLMGLSLTIGILVDDSIVIIEATARAAARGLNGVDAALAGRRDLGGAAFAITLVDVAVFLPIGVMTGIVGEFMREFGLVVVFATAFSLLTALTLTPLLSARWAPAGSKRVDLRALPWTMRRGPIAAAIAAWHGLLDAFEALEMRAARAYVRRWLPFAIEHRGIVFTAAALVCAAAVAPLFAGRIPSEFAPPIARGYEAFDLTFPEGTPLAVTDDRVRDLTMKLLDDAAVGHVEATAGKSFDGRSDVFASNVAHFTVVLADPADDGGAVERRVRKVAVLEPSAVLAGSGKGMGGVPAVSYTISGNPASIDAAAERLASALRRNPDAADVRVSDLGLAPYVRVAVDPARALLLGISPDDAAQTARITTGGSIAVKARLATGLTDVLVRATAARAGNLDLLSGFQIRSARGTLVPLSDVSTIERTGVPAVIERENGSRVVSVTANPGPGIAISALTAPIARILRDPNALPAGTRIEPRGDIEQFFDTVARIGAALALSLLCVYCILAVLYRSYALPLLIMLTVPLASIGAFGSLAVSGQPLNLYSMLGIVMLVGLAAKNGILLIEYAERAVRSGAPAMEAAVRAAELRFRPIVMTTLAMIAGMLPLALGTAIGAEYRRALGIVVIGGLTSSLFLTLFVVPAAYAAYRGRARAVKSAIVNRAQAV